MITASDVKARMVANPFSPFRLCMSDGKTYDIQNHDMAFVTRNSVIVGLNLDSEDIAEKYVLCSMLHITRVEDIVPAKAA